MVTPFIALAAASLSKAHRARDAGRDKRFDRLQEIFEAEKGAASAMRIVGQIRSLTDVYKRLSGEYD